MASATDTSRGRITLPTDVRRALAIGAGDRVEFVQLDVGQFVLIAANRSVLELKGMFATQAAAVAIEDMNEVIGARGASAGEL